jgi:23S rRNA pseudouridine2605 synthase
MAEERLQKILAQAGYGSRRGCELYILSGRVSVNGHIATIGEKADIAKDKILVDSKPIHRPPEPVYIALNKPRQVLSAIHQDDSRPDVLNYVPVDANLFPVGRLDYDSEGLILLTNDGDFANQLTHPRYEHDKEYIVQIGSRPDTSQLEIWRRGVVLEDGYRTAPARVELIDSSPNAATLRVVMHEGRKRQIREIGSTIGLPVLRIKRVRIGLIQLGTLKPGEWRYLSESEIRQTLKKTSPDRRPYRKPAGATSFRRAAVPRTGLKRPMADKSRKVDTSGGDRRPRVNTTRTKKKDDRS